MPTARSQRYKSTHNLQDKIISLPTTSWDELLSLNMTLLEQTLALQVHAQNKLSEWTSKLLAANAQSQKIYAQLQQADPQLRGASAKNDKQELLVPQQHQMTLYGLEEGGEAFIPQDPRPSAGSGGVFRHI